MKTRLGLWITLAVALGYVGYLGAHWLPLGMSEHEMSASASRVWDVKREIVEHHLLPWWTPNFMSGSSYGLNHSRGFYLVPWMFFSMFTDLMTAGKLTALLAILGGAMAMYGCARHFLKNEWAATLAALAFLLHPEQIIRAAGAEHITILLFFPFIPLLWWTLSRALERNTFRDTFLCALVAVLAWWTDNKQAFINFLFLFGYAAYWIWPRRRQWQPTARTCGWLAALGLTLGAWTLAPGFVESKDVKLFIGDPLAGWQKTYSFKSLLALVDRDGATTSNTVATVFARIQANGGRVNSQAELDQVQRLMLLNSNSPEKYMGILLVLVLAVTVLWNDRRVDRRAFWFFIAALLASVLFATGLETVWTANTLTWSAFSGQQASGVPMLWLLITAVFLGLFVQRKLTTTPKRIIAGIALAVFLFLPGFRLLASLPYFSEIRAPFVFYDTPAVFLGAMLAGYFVTDVLAGRTTRLPILVAGVVAMVAMDYWPYQKPMKTSSVPAHTIQNLEATYTALRPDKDWVKTYSVTGRYFHLLGPMYSGKPQVYEAFYNWMCPLGTGLLNQAGGGSREFLNLLAARYIIHDKTDPGMASPQMQQILAAYRQAFPVFLENEDFVVFRNDTAHAYITGYARACLFTGDVRRSPALALALSAKNWPLVHSDRVDAAKYEKLYNDDTPAFPPINRGTPVELSDVQLTRENAQLVRIQLHAPIPCLAVIAESYYPYWRAEIDGRPVEVLRVSCGLMGVELPGGTHEIVLRYQPPRVYALAGIVSVLALLAGCVATIRSSRANRP